MSNQRIDFNSSTSQGLERTMKQVAIYAFEALKAIALFLKHLLSTFIGK